MLSLLLAKKNLKLIFGLGVILITHYFQAHSLPLKVQYPQLPLVMVLSGILHSPVNFFN